MANANPMSWLVILLIMLGVSLVAGFLFLGVGSEIGLPDRWRGWLYAITLGIAASSLVTRRRMALEKQKAAMKKATGPKDAE